MTASAIVFAFVVLVAISYVAIIPLLTNQQTTERKRKTKSEDADVEGLETQYRRLINSIHDLDFDYDTGKVSDGIYSEQRKFLIGRSVSVLRQLDLARSEISDIEDEIETAIAARRKRPSSSKSNKKQKSLEKEIAVRRKRRQKVSS